MKSKPLIHDGPVSIHTALIALGIFLALFVALAVFGMLTGHRRPPTPLGWIVVYCAGYQAVQTLLLRYLAPALRTSLQKRSDPSSPSGSNP